MIRGFTGSRIKLQHRRALLSWASVAALAVLCAALGLLQYRWIGEIAEAERARLREDLKTRLTALGEAVGAGIIADWRALIAPAYAIARLGREAAYAAAWARWQPRRGSEFVRIALAVPEPDDLHLLILSTRTGKFSPAGWPSAWTLLQQQLATHLSGFGPDPAPHQGALFEIPRFSAAAPDQPPREQEWLILELSPVYARDILLPEMLKQYMEASAITDYDFEVTDRAHPPAAIFTAGHPIGMEQADAAIGLLNLGPRIAGPGPFPPEGRRPGWPGPPARTAGPRHPAFDRRPPGEDSSPPPPDMSRWQLRARHRAGSLDLLVARTRQRNLAVSGAVLLLIMATAAMLVRSSRQAHRLADLEMNFVAGVSHELRTPLTVIRTAAWNLRGAWLTHRPERVEQYGNLIHQESAKLERLVEQVLHFASAKAGHATRQRENVAASDVINGAVQSAMAALEGTGIQLQAEIAGRLPAIMADRLALTRAIEICWRTPVSMEPAIFDGSASPPARLWIPGTRLSKSACRIAGRGFRRMNKRLSSILSCEGKPRCGSRSGELASA